MVIPKKNVKSNPGLRHSRANEALKIWGLTAFEKSASPTLLYIIENVPRLQQSVAKKFIVMSPLFLMGPYFQSRSFHRQPSQSASLWRRKIRYNQTNKTQHQKEYWRGPVSTESKDLKPFGRLFQSLGAANCIRCDASFSSARSKAFMSPCPSKF